ncbi:MAG TPA: undecaprenyl-diphosphatase UppP [Actinomycetota bacterium]|nr:undecaprenyl-diphosphatase UppP [Actinomycetota bacterium]
MSLLHALVLGLVQGLTEFIPVSSSGHLQLVPFIFGWKTPSVAFDVAVHFGTLLAVVYVFREEVMRLIRTVIHWRDAGDADRMLLRLIVIGTIPAVIVGAALNHWVESVFQRPVVISLLLGVTGYLLLSAETKAEARTEPARAIDELTNRDGAIVGGWQAFSILPGVSRSGATIGGAMRLGISRQAAARYSFLLSIPVIAGAILFKLPDMVHKAGATGVGPFIVGILMSALSGFVAVKWFLRMIRLKGLRPFGVYCFFAMVAGLITALARG